MKRKIKGNRPRIGVDIHVLEGIHQGSRTHCAELFSRVVHLLPQFDFRFFADASRLNARDAKLFSAANAEVVDMPHANPIARLGAQLPRLVKEQKIDLLHTQYICPFTASSATAVTIHDILFEDYPQFFEPFLRYRSKLLVRLSALRASMIFTVSDYSKQRIVARYGVPPTKITKIANGAETSKFFPGNEGDARLKALGLAAGGYLLTVGRLEPRKNHASLLQAYATLPQPRLRLVIVGQRDFGYKKIFDSLESLQLVDEVLFMEEVDDELLAILYRNCKIFLYPSFAEGFGMPILEAMASGAPVITSKTTALAEIAGDAAILVDPDSFETIAQAIRRLLSDEELCARMRTAGMQHFAAYSWDTSSATLAAAYRQHFEERA